jgi:hypothetical protein
METILITQDDIKVYRPTAELDQERIVPYIREAQILDLKPVLNDVFYYDFVKRFNDSEDAKYAVYQSLLNGKEYTYSGDTYFFDGLKPMLCYYALARFVSGNPINITRAGIVVKTNQQSQPADASVIRAAVNELRSSAMFYQNDVVKFLERNPTDYPLWQTEGADSNTGRKTSLNLFKL